MTLDNVISVDNDCDDDDASATTNTTTATAAAAANFTAIDGDIIGFYLEKNVPLVVSFIEIYTQISQNY